MNSPQASLKEFQAGCGLSPLVEFLDLKGKSGELSSLRPSELIPAHLIFQSTAVLAEVQAFLLIYYSLCQLAFLIFLHSFPTPPPKPFHCVFWGIQSMLGAFFLFLFFLRSFFFLLMWIIFNVSIEFGSILLLFYVLGMRHVGSQLPSQGLNLQPPPWKVKS